MSRQRRPFPLPRSFFNRPVLEVARDLLGKFLVHRLPVVSRTYDRGGVVERLMITEVEAYDGECDLACHANKGRTKRTEVMYGAAGHWYVYLCYGMYEMLNMVTGPKGYPAAVLIRGVEGINGPGRLTKSAMITRALNGKPAARASGLWVEESGVVVPKKEIARTPRIGVAYAGEWARKPYRFIWKRKI